MARMVSQGEMNRRPCRGREREGERMLLGAGAAVANGNPLRAPAVAALHPKNGLIPNKLLPNGLLQMAHLQDGLFFLKWAPPKWMGDSLPILLVAHHKAVIARVAVSVRELFGQHSRDLGHEAVRRAVRSGEQPGEAAQVRTRCTLLRTSRRAGGGRDGKWGRQGREWARWATGWRQARFGGVRVSGRAGRRDLWPWRALSLR